MRTILVPVDGASDNEGLLNTTFDLARTLRSHVKVLHVRADPRDAVPLFGEGMSGDMIEDMIATADKDTLARAGELKRLFERLCAHAQMAQTNSPQDAGDGPSAHWCEDEGREDEIVAWRGRLADLIVVARPDEDASPMRALTLQSALFECGRPVLALPPNKALHKIGSRVAIAWNGTPQAARAVQGAMAFITQAEEVVILTCDSDKTEANAASELQTYLAWHGVASKVVDCVSGGSDVGGALLSSCTNVGADLLVCGAYSHSRLVQTVLGGVTSSVMELAELPVLFSH